MSEYSNRGLAERLGFTVVQDDQEECRPLRWRMRWPDGRFFPSRFFDPGHAWLLVPRFDTDPDAMLALMERLREMGATVVITATLRQYNAEVVYHCPEPGYCEPGTACADTPMAALAHAAWAALKETS